MKIPAVIICKLRSYLGSMAHTLLHYVTGMLCLFPSLPTLCIH